MYYIALVSKLVLVDFSALYLVSQVSENGGIGPPLNNNYIVAILPVLIEVLFFWCYDRYLGRLASN